MSKFTKLNLNDVLTTGQIAKFCRVDPRTVKRWIDQGILKSHPLPLTQFNRIRVDDFMKFLNEQNMLIPEDLKHLGRKRILIVDDEVNVRRVIQQVLSQQMPEKIEFQTAEDGFEAGRILEKFKPDLVILDLMIPQMNGFDVCRKIKSNPETQHMKVLIVSAFLEEDQQKIFELGADDILEKPFEDKELKHRVSQFLGLKDIP